MNVVAILLGDIKYWMQYLSGKINFDVLGYLNNLEFSKFSMPLKKIIYISYMPLSAKVAQDWFIDFFISRGAAVEYWDVSSVVFGKSIGKSSEANFLHELTGYADIKRMLSYPENKNAYYFVLMSYEGRTSKLFKMISDCDSKLFYISWGHLPRAANGRSWRDLVLQKLLNPQASVTAILNKIKANLWIKVGFVRPFDVVFAAGSAAVGGGASSKVVPINSADFDIFKQFSLEQNNLARGQRIAVFLDQYLPHHPDIGITSHSPLSPTSYYLALNKFFGLLELEYGVKVVIAAHPKSNYETHTFCGRDIVRDKTAELVGAADFVIAHYSTSISYAVLFKKPLVFIYTGEMLQLYSQTIVASIRCFSDYLNAAICNVDEVENVRKICIDKVNEECYQKYIYEFLTTPESESKMTSEIVWHELESLSGKTEQLDTR